MTDYTRIDVANFWLRKPFIKARRMPGIANHVIEFIDDAQLTNASQLPPIPDRALAGIARGVTGELALERAGDREAVAHCNFGAGRD
jgi:hypothetical protein